MRLKTRLDALEGKYKHPQQSQWRRPRDRIVRASELKSGAHHLLAEAFSVDASSAPRTRLLGNSGQLVHLPPVGTFRPIMFI